MLLEATTHGVRASLHPKTGIVRVTFPLLWYLCPKWQRTTFIIACVVGQGKTQNRARVVLLAQQCSLFFTTVEVVVLTDGFAPKRLPHDSFQKHNGRLTRRLVRRHTESFCAKDGFSSCKRAVPQLGYISNRLQPARLVASPERM